MSEVEAVLRQAKADLDARRRALNEEAARQEHKFQVPGWGAV